MIETCLFLPDNLMVILYEEQKLIQSILSFPFRNTVPLFKTKEKFNSIEIFPPILSGSFIVRPCNSPNSFDIHGGFVLGNAGKEAEHLISKLENLKLKTKLPVFSVLKCCSWYYADLEFTENIKTGFCTWSIKNKVWQKAGK